MVGIAADDVALEEGDVLVLLRRAVKDSFLLFLGFDFVTRLKDVDLGFGGMVHAM